MCCIFFTLLQGYFAKETYYFKKFLSFSYRDRTCEISDKDFVLIVVISGKGGVGGLYFIPTDPHQIHRILCHCC